jgi:DAD family
VHDDEDAVGKVLKDAFPKGQDTWDPGTACVWSKERRFGHVDLTTTTTDTTFSSTESHKLKRKKKKGMAGPKTPAKQAPATPNTAGASKRAKTSTVASTSSSTSSAATSASKVALHTLWAAYLNTTPSRLKLVDAFLVFLVLSGVIQFVYCVLVTSFPFNAFLAGCVLTRFNSSHCNWRMILFLFFSSVGWLLVADEIGSPALLANSCSLRRSARKLT